jgi:hypothetical protein
VLSIPRQRLKIYSKNNQKIIIHLKNAKVEDVKDKEFVLNVEVGKKLQFYAFRAKDENEAQEWVECIKRAAFINNSNMVSLGETLFNLLDSR